MKYSKLKFQKFHFINSSKNGRLIEWKWRHVMDSFIVLSIKIPKGIWKLLIWKNHFDYFFDSRLRWWTYIDWPLCFNFPFYTMLLWWETYAPWCAKKSSLRFEALRRRHRSLWLLFLNLDVSFASLSCSAWTAGSTPASSHQIFIKGLCTNHVGK